MNYKLNEKISIVESTTGVGNGLYDIGTGATDRFRFIWAVKFQGDSASTFYADLAEKYTVAPGPELEEGTVMEVSGLEYDAEVCEAELSNCVMGVISKNPGFIMNEGLKDSCVIGLVGTLPVRVVGPVVKKDILVSAGNGCLRAVVNDSEKAFKVAISFETNDEADEKLVKCFVK